MIDPTHSVFRDEAQYEFLNVLQRHWQEIRQEYEGVRDRLVAWHERKLHGVGWDVFPLFAFPNGEPIAEATEACPRTADLIERAIPRHGVGGFSVLAPGARIKPHTGYQGAFLRCHLGLQIPDGDCGLVVAGQTYRWREGVGVVFDDRLEHYAWNLTAASRVVLLVDFVPDAT